MYEINKYGKIVVNEKEVYYGCIVSIDFKNEIVKIQVTDWRDRFNQPKRFSEMITPISKFTIKYGVEE